MERSDTIDSTAGVSAGPGLLLSNIRVLLASLAHLARTDLQLPLCCLGLVPHQDTAPGKGSDRLLCVYADGSCRHKVPLDAIVESSGLTETRLQGVRKVHLGSECCGIWTVWPDKDVSGDREREFRRLFRIAYLRYWCYQESRSRFPGEKPIAILGSDPALLSAVERIERCARSSLPILLTGETGTGKELWARAIHLRSTRRAEPFLPVNCAHLLDDSLSLSNLFGHTRGSFTGAMENRHGYLKGASGGTLFLDEIESLPLPMQGALLRTLESGEIQPVGRDQPTRVDLRIIAATNEDLNSLVRTKLFRKDLYYRLKGQSIYLPALRDRGAWDIEQLVRFVLFNLTTGAGENKALESDTVLPALCLYPWPGNVRELIHAVSVAYYESDQRAVITLDDFPEEIRRFPQASGNPENGEVAHILYRRLTGEGESFWELVHQPYLDRELNRSQVRKLIRLGMQRAKNYKSLALEFNIPPDQYQKFMDFLRHHRLRTSAR